MQNMRAMIVVLVSGCVVGTAAGSPVAAQTASDASATAAFTTGLSAGGTYYCIVSRCGTGATIGISAGFDLTRVFAVTASAGKHFCSDCDRFFLGDAALQARMPGRTLEPFVSGGLSLASDPGLMGREIGLFGAAGTAVRLSPDWGARVQVSGRSVGRGDAMGEISIGAQRKLQ